MRWRVMISAPYMLPVVEDYRPRFAARGIELVVPPVEERLSEAELLEWVPEVDGIICGDDRFSARVYEAAKRLKVIAKWGTGIDSILKEEADRHGVRVFNTPNAFSHPVADSVLAYVLSFARRTPWMDRAMKQGEWAKIPGRALNECTLGIIGVGNIGRAVAMRARGFGIALLGNDPQPVDKTFLDAHGMRMVDLDSLLAQSDFISLNCDLNPTSEHLIDAAAFEKMRIGAVLINCARGPVVDEGALVEALRSGRLGGAGLDVYEEEPLPAESPLRQMDNVLLAPHNSNSSPSAWRRVHENTFRQVIDVLVGSEKG